MRCNNCGNELKETDKFCGLCGTPNPNYTAPAENFSASAALADNTTIPYQSASLNLGDNAQSPYPPAPLTPVDNTQSPYQPAAPNSADIAQSPYKSAAPDFSDSAHNQPAPDKALEEKPAKEKRTAPLWLCILCIIIIFVLSIACGALAQLHFGASGAAIAEFIERTIIW